MIILDSVTVTRDGNKILDEVNLHIKEGDILTIIGPNGAGKSTLLDVIAGRMKPTSGRVVIDGVEVTDLNDIDRAPLIARLCQNPRQNVVDAMSVAENLVLAQLKGRRARLSLASKTLTSEYASLLLQSVMGDEAQHLLDREMEHLSGGQRQRIAFAIATANIPKILLLDEPTAALDPCSAALMVKEALDYIMRNKITTLLITHDMSLATHLGARLIVLKKGKIESSGIADSHSHAAGAFLA